MKPDPFNNLFYYAHVTKVYRPSSSGGWIFRYQDEYTATYSNGSAAYRGFYEELMD